MLPVALLVAFLTTTLTWAVAASNESLVIILPELTPLEAACIKWISELVLAACPLVAPPSAFWGVPSFPKAITPLYVETFSPLGFV